MFISISFRSNAFDITSPEILKISITGMQLTLSQIPPESSMSETVCN